MRKVILQTFQMDTVISTKSLSLHASTGQFNSILKNAEWSEMSRFVSKFNVMLAGVKKKKKSNFTNSWLIIPRLAAERISVKGQVVTRAESRWWGRNERGWRGWWFGGVRGREDPPVRHQAVVWAQMSDMTPVWSHTERITERLRGI